jgi:type IV pilus assembly protein PilM
MVEFFSEKLQTPIEFFNPLKNVTVTNAAAAESLAAKAQTVGELVGAALRSLDNCPIEINLRPQSVVREQDLSRRKPFLVAAAICCLLTLAAWWLFFDRAARITNEVLVGVNSDVSRLEGLAGQMNALSAEQKKLDALAAPLLLAAAERTAWVGILDELGAKLPSRYIWITDLQPLAGGKVPGSDKPGAPAAAATAPRPGQPPAGSPSISALEIKGLYLDNPPNEKEARIIDEFVENLKASPLFALPEEKEKIITQRTTPTGENWAYGYTLVLPLRNPILLP